MRKLFLSFYDVVKAIQQGHLSLLDEMNAIFFFHQSADSLLLQAGLVPIWVINLYEDDAFDQCLEDYDRLVNTLRAAKREGRAVFLDENDADHLGKLNGFLEDHGYAAIVREDLPVTREPTWNELADAIVSANLTLDAIAA